MNAALSWPLILGRLIEKTDLDRASASWAMDQILAGDATEAQVGAFMMALRSKGESVDELAGLVASQLNADAVIILTSVEGFLTGDPKDKKSQVIPEIEGLKAWEIPESHI